MGCWILLKSFQVLTNKLSASLRLVREDEIVKWDVHILELVPATGYSVVKSVPFELEPEWLSGKLARCVKAASGIEFESW